jgi:UDP-3-O-[3-hydroxymyristoyl] glucosamine N-acyltransferase
VLGCTGWLKGRMRLDELAVAVGATLDGDGAVDIVGLAPIEEARPGELSFVANPRYAKFLGSTRASAVIVGADVDTGGLPALRAEEPYAAFVAALSLFDRRPQPQPGIHSSAVIAASAEIGEGAYIGPGAVVGEDVKIGVGARLFPHTVIYPQARIGDRFTAHAGSVVRECVTIGDDVTLQPGVVLGGDGFGFLPVGEVPPAIPQIGGVRVGDAVDIGANTTVDRAAVGDTKLDRGVKLDNLVMIAHGCRIGGATMIAAQSGMAGSTVIGKGVLAGGQSGASGHLEIGDGARLSSGAGVTSDVPPGQTVGGFPAAEAGKWRRSAVALLRLPELLKRVRALEKRLARMAGDDEV